jgi:DNA-binding IclR family transcriptional regulator
MKTIRAVERAMSILGVFKKQRKPLNLTELCEYTQLPKPTLLRLLITMEAEGYIVKNNHRNTYLLGPVFIELANVVLENIDLRTIMRPIMEKLKEISNETVNVYVVSGITRICIDQVVTDRLLKKFSRIGDTLPLYCGASGKVLLAFSDRKLWEEVIQQTGLKGFTSNTITDRNALYEELEKIKRQGYGISYGEREENIISVAVPIFNCNGEIAAALAISGPYQRMADKVDYYKEKLLEEAREVSYKFEF